MKESKRFRGFYAEEAAVYHRRRYETPYGTLFRRLHHDALRALLPVPGTGLRGLEIACGTGHTSEVLAASGMQLVACDLTPQMMAQARARVREAGGEAVFSLADAMRLPFADASFDAVVSTRFLHLFPPPEQRRVLGEAARVLRPGGSLIVDFDNWWSRWLMALPLLAYNLLRYRRLAPYAVYNRLGPTRRMLEEVGIRVDAAWGLGGVHLLPLTWLSDDVAREVGEMHRDRPLRVLAEQFMVRGKRR